MSESIRSRKTLRSIPAVLIAAAGLLVPAVARAQSSTLPPSDIQNQPAAPPPLPPAPEPAPEPAPAAPVEAQPPAVVPAPVPAPVLEVPPPVAPVPAALPATAEPLAGFSDGVAFLRSPDNSFIFFPGGRLQVDHYEFHGGPNKVPNNTFLLRRARLELTGWIGGWAYFSIAGDFALGAPASTPVAQANLGTTDDYIAIAPWKNLFILQVGQYDAPFTLENRTSDKYFDFMERSITVRAFGISDNKEMGASIFSFNDDRNYHLSLGVFNGDGQNFKNADTGFDLMGRGWIAPFSFQGDGPLHDVGIGASFWTGNRNNTLVPANQSTQGGFTFLDFTKFTGTAPAMTTAQFRQVGRLNSFAVELNAPIAHRYGVRGEFVWRHSPLSEAQSTATGSVGPAPGSAIDLRGTSFYGEVFAWVLGDDKIIGDQQGLEPFARYSKFGVKPVRDGVMVALRYEHLDESLSADTLGLGSAAAGKTVVDSGELGVNYWHSKRFRGTFNYVANHFGRDSDATPLLKGLKSAWEHEFLFRLAVAL